MKTLLATSTTLALAAGHGLAQQAQIPENLERLQNMRSTEGASFEDVDQGGDYAAGIRDTLDRVELPDGFEIALYAVVPDARHMAVGPNGLTTIVGTRKDQVWSVTDRNKDRTADDVRNFGPR